MVCVAAILQSLDVLTVQAPDSIWRIPYTDIHTDPATSREQSVARFPLERSFAMGATGSVSIRSWLVACATVAATGCSTIDERSYLNRERLAAFAPLAVKATIFPPPTLAASGARPEESVTVESFQLGIVALVLLPVSLAVDAARIHSASERSKAESRFGGALMARSWEEQQLQFETLLRDRLAATSALRVLGPDAVNDAPAATLEAEVRLGLSSALDVLVVQGTVRIDGDSTAQYFSRFVVLSDPLVLPDRASPDASLAVQSAAQLDPRCDGAVIPMQRGAAPTGAARRRWTATDSCRWRAAYWIADDGVHVSGGARASTAPACGAHSSRRPSRNPPEHGRTVGRQGALSLLL
jgi:hypothetical protein